MGEEETQLLGFTVFYLTYILFPVSYTPHPIPYTLLPLTELASLG
jgi:hypothetical protein